MCSMLYYRCEHNMSLNYEYSFGKLNNTSMLLLGENNQKAALVKCIMKAHELIFGVRHIV